MNCRRVWRSSFWPLLPSFDRPPRLGAHPLLQLLEEVQDDDVSNLGASGTDAEREETPIVG